MIGPPYTHEFVNLFLPLINNEYISGFLKSDEEKVVHEFLHYCKENNLFWEKNEKLVKIWKEKTLKSFFFCFFNLILLFKNKIMIRRRFEKSISILAYLNIYYWI